MDRRRVVSLCRLWIAFLHSKDWGGGSRVALARIGYWIVWTLRLGLYAGVALAVLAWLAMYGARFGSYLDILSSFQRQYAIGTALLLGAALLLRRWRVAGLTALVLVLFVMRLATTLPSKPAEQGNAPDLKAISANLHFYNRDRLRILAWVQEKEPDVIAFQEYGAALHPELSKALRMQYPYAEAAPANNPLGVAFYSRIPFRRIALPASDRAILRQGGRRNDQLAVYEMDLNGTTLTVIHVHPPPPIGGKKQSQRNQELELIGRVAAACKTPVVVLGDFNVAPWSPYFQDLLKAGGLHSADGGLGMTPTWPVRGVQHFPPMLPAIAMDFARVPIDYFLGGPGIAFQNFVRGPDVGSDHFPLYAEILVQSP